MILCDADYVFTMIDVGSYERIVVTTMSSVEHVNKMFISPEKKFPPPWAISENYAPLPFTIVVHEALNTLIYPITTYAASLNSFSGL